jgi:hypothetical protein
VQVPVDGRYLMRALQLGFAEIFISQPEQPLLCRDASRSYLWMPLSYARAVSARGQPADPNPSS